MRLILCVATFSLSVAVFGQDLETVESLFWQKNYEEAERASRALVEQEAEARYYLAMTLIETKRSGA